MRYRRRLKCILLKFLRIPGNPHKVALGFALGSVINFVPTFGFAIPIAIFLAGLFRINIVAAVIGDIIFKPIFPLFLYLDVKVGHLFSGKTVHYIGYSFFLGMTVNIIVFSALIYMIVYVIFKFFRIPMLKDLHRNKMLN